MGTGQARDNLARTIADIDASIVVHHEHAISLIEVIARTPHDQNRRDTKVAVKRGNTINQGRDRFFLCLDKLTHTPIANHEVRCACVLIDHKQGRTQLNCLDQRSSLRR